MNCIWVKFEKRRPTFFQIHGMSVYTCIKCHLIRNSTQTAVTKMTIKRMLSCLSLQFVYYFLLSYDGQRERIFTKMSFTQLENHSQLLCGHDFANERLLVCQFDV